MPRMCQSARAGGGAAVGGGVGWGELAREASGAQMVRERQGGFPSFGGGGSDMEGGGRSFASPSNGCAAGIGHRTNDRASAFAP